MRRKIFRVIMLIVDTLLLLICAILLIQMNMMRNSLIEGNEQAGIKVETISKEAMDKQARALLSESSQVRATVADQEFSDFMTAIGIIAESAEDIYTSGNRYGECTLRKYGESEKGQLVTYAAYGDGVDPNDEAIKKEVSLISNMQGMMIAVNDSNDSMASDYFATASGVFLGTEVIADYNISKDGKPLSFEARVRPWYTGAVEAGKPYFTGIIKDVDTGRDVVTCGIPVYAGGDLKGVAGAGLYLDTLRENVGNYHLGENGYACIINSQGQILFSGSDEGELADSEDAEADLRESSNKELADLVTEAISGSSDMRIITLDGNKYYIAYAPMETVGWSYFTVLPEQEVAAPSQKLLDELDKSNMQQNELVKSSIYSSLSYILLVLIIIFLLAALISTKFATRLAAPVVRLTNDVSKIEGDNLDFTWDIDTGDEVQTLAKSFEFMTDRMKQYIEDITVITAEKERIGAELSVATHIQASMLPSLFPPFPDRKEFELYAKMDPAKEVGGDFYDFFFVDDDHIALVIADVSGKGVPAALFMVIAKTLIKNHAKAQDNVDGILASANDQLCEGNGEEMFVTAWIGVIDLRTGLMRYCDAGHEYPYIIHSDGNVEMLKPPKKKPPLAAMEGIKYMANELMLQKGDCVFLYTDGVPEATDANDQLYGTDRLEKILTEKAYDDTETLLTDVRADVDAFVGDAPQFDDLTMLAFRLKDLTGEV